jgi:hypothetical protein
LFLSCLFFLLLYHDPRLGLFASTFPLICCMQHLCSPCHDNPDAWLLAQSMHDHDNLCEHDSYPCFMYYIMDESTPRNCNNVTFD